MSHSDLMILVILVWLSLFVGKEIIEERKNK